MKLQFLEKYNSKGAYTMFLVFFLFPFFVFSQTLTGNIISETGDKIPFANVIIKESINTEKISEFTLAKNGIYTISLKKAYKKVFVVVNATNYETVVKEVQVTDKDEKLSLDFTLKREKVREIQEVIIKQKKDAFEVKEDTVVYDVSRYKDPADRKVQDVLKKMPGITVNDKTGEIKYKGKPVEAVKLEGDDLFGTNYTVGTKNINIDIVEKVEAIENYSDNPLLKGIESSDKVALNLKIKKGKIDFSGNIDWASGFNADSKQMQAINTNLLQVAKNYKSFLNLSYNNIGVNQSPYDYFSNSLSIDQQKDSNYSATKVIPDNSFGSFIDDNRANRNNAFFSSYNLIFKAIKKNSTRVNISYLKDKLIQDIYNESMILDENITISDSYRTKKSPEFYRVEIDSKTNTSKKSLLEYKLTAYNENSNQYSSIIQNGVKNYETDLLTKNSFLKQTVQFTYKLNEKSALQFNTTYSWNNIPQTINSLPDFSINNDEKFNTQLSNFKKSILDIQLLFLGKYKSMKYLFSVESINETNRYNSSIVGQNTNSFENAYFNNFVNNRNSFYFSGQINFNFSKLYIQPSYNLVYQKQNIVATNFEKDRLLFEPKLYLKYKINDTSLINGIISYNQKLFSEDKLIINPVFISNRNIISNIASLEIQKTFNSRLSYIINDLYKQLNFNFGIYYTNDKGNYFSEINIAPYLTSYKYFYSPNTRNTYGLDFSYDKYFSFLDSVIKLGSNVSFSNYENIVNGSDIRKINSNSITNDFSWRTVFDLKINFENKFTYNINTTKVETGENNILKSFNNSFKIIAKPLRKVSLISGIDNFIPNIDKKTNYIFIDSTIRYTVNRNWELSFFAKNLLNKRNITEIDINDYSINTTNAQIIPRYFLFNITYNF